MPVTPKGIWTPDDSDDWDLTIDLAAMANSIDTAVEPAIGTTIIRYSTVATLLASAPPGSSLASADNAPGGIWRRGGGQWRLITAPSFANATARNAAIPAPADGWEIYNSGLSCFQIYYDSSSVANPGWYSQKSINVFRRGSTVNTIPTSAGDVPASSATMNFDNYMYATFNFSGELQNNVTMSSQFMLNIDGSDVATARWERNETGGSPKISVAGQDGRLMAPGAHTVKLRAVANTAGLSVLTAPSWSMVATMPILGTY